MAKAIAPEMRAFRAERVCWWGLEDARHIAEEGAGVVR
jgi:hypothetical protein